MLLQTSVEAARAGHAQTRVEQLDGRTWAISGVGPQAQGVIRKVKALRVLVRLHRRAVGA